MCVKLVYDRGRLWHGVANNVVYVLDRTVNMTHHGGKEGVKVNPTASGVVKCKVRNATAPIPMEASGDHLPFLGVPLWCRLQSRKDLVLVKCLQLPLLPAFRPDTHLALAMAPSALLLAFDSGQFSTQPSLFLALYFVPVFPILFSLALASSHDTG